MSTPVSTEDAVPKQPLARSIATDLHALIASGLRFQAVLADPPWRYSNTSSRGAAENHYPTMSLEEICSEPVEQLVTDRAHLWTTNGFLEEAFQVIRAWGFEYKSCMVWTKPTIGMGNFYTFDVDRKSSCTGTSSRPT